MFTRESIARHRAAILEIASRHGTHDVRVFGSVARGEARADSDLDLVVRFEATRSLMDHAALIGDLEDLLHGRVDVIDATGCARGSAPRLSERRCPCDVAGAL